MHNPVLETEKTRRNEHILGNFRGEVIDNRDPLQNGRCRVRIFSIFDQIPDDHLPWATFCDPFMGGLEDVGSSFVPEIGTHVWCFFEGGDVRYPAYFAGAPAMNGKGNPDLPSESREEGNYPDNKVIKTKSGLVISFNGTEGNVKFEIKHPSGSSLTIDASGFEEHIEGDRTISATDMLQLEGDLIKLGIGASEPVPLGAKLLQWLASHTHPTSSGPSGPPTQPPKKDLLSEKVITE